MKFFLFLIFFASNHLFSQDITNLNQRAVGMITSDEGTFLILENGYLRVMKNDPYEDYYQKIYNDSTIVNPNTEIKSAYNVDFFPYLIPFQKNKQINFSQPVNLGILIQISKSNNLQLTNYGTNLIDSLSSKK